MLKQKTICVMKRESDFAARTPSLGIKSHNKTSLGKTKTPVPANCFAGTGDESCGATRLDAYACVHSCVLIYAGV